MKKSNVVAMEEKLESLVDTTQKTDKKVLKRADKLVRDVDNILSDLNVASRDAQELMGLNTVEYYVTEKDADRFQELVDVLQSTSSILYHLTSRMARKYTGKTIEPIGSNEKRKALKA